MLIGFVNLKIIPHQIFFVREHICTRDTAEMAVSYCSSQSSPIVNVLVMFIRFLILCKCISIFVKAEESEFKAFASFNGIGD
jgi:hypothetical protein